MRRIIGRPLAIAAIALLLVVLVQSFAVACPTCGEALDHQDAGHNGVAKGFFYSILFMMGMPYLLLSTFCGCMYWKVRRARAAKASAANGPAAVGPVVATRAAVPSPAASATVAVPVGERREPVEV